MNGAVSAYSQSVGGRWVTTKTWSPAAGLPFQPLVMSNTRRPISRSTSTHHLYFEPFQHDDHLIRLLTAEPNTGLDALTEEGKRHAVLIVTRNKELWGDQGAANDVLTINGTNVINAATSPQSKRTIGLFAFDAGSDGQSNVGAPLPAFFSLPFISGVDLAIPASRPPDGRI